MSSVPAARGLLFVCHDPGARNHVLPLFERSQGGEAELVDLRARGADAHGPDEGLGGERLPRLLIVGCSTNRSERAWVRKVTALGVPSLCVMDAGCLANRLGDLSADEVCSGYAVTCEAMADELRGVLSGVPGGREPLVRSVGSTYMESLLSAGLAPDPAASPAVVRAQAGAEEGDVLVVFFASPEEPTISPPALAEHGLAAIRALIRELEACGRSVFLWVRPHPRSSPELLEGQRRLLEASSLRALFDPPARPGRPPNTAVFGALDVCLSWSSSCVDCACYPRAGDRPAPLVAFLTEGWPEVDRFVSEAMDWAVDSVLPRVAAAELRQLLERGWAAEAALAVGGAWREKHLGARARTLALAGELAQGA